MNDLGNPELGPLLRALGREIAAARTREGWSQGDLAHATTFLSGDHKPVSEKQVGKIERGTHGQLHEIWQVALALRVPLSRLVLAAEERPPANSPTGKRKSS